MFTQSRTDTRNSLARKAIKSVYDKDFYKRQIELASFFQEFLDSSAGDVSKTSFSFRYSWLKQARCIITHKLTTALIQTIPQNWQRMAEMRYSPKAYKQTKVSDDLFIATGTLNNWELKLLEMVTNYAILLRISKEDIFYLPRLVNMVSVLTDMTLLIRKLDTYTEKPIVSPAFIANINQRMNNYQAIISCLDKHKHNHKQGFMQMIVSTKCNNPEATAKQIGINCGIHPSVVGKYINMVYEETKPYLV